MRKIWDKFVAWVLSIPADKRLFFVCGLIISAFFAIALGMKFCFWPLIFVAGGVEFFNMWTSDQKFDVWRFVATLLGALVPQVFVLLHMWWF